jgi:hypothetical protein
MDLINNLTLGFGVALQPVNLLYCFFGVFIGTLIGVLPGIGPVAAMSLLLPVTFNASPEAGIIMLAGIYYGSMYGGSTTAILVNIPGEAASVVTCLDGHEMAKQGRAGPALGIAAIGSFIAGTVAVLGLMLVAPALARFAVKFGPAEYFSLMILGLSILTYLSHGSLIKALIMACFGLVLGLIGLDSITGIPRMTFDRMEFVDGPVRRRRNPRQSRTANQARDRQCAYREPDADPRRLAGERRAARARVAARLPARHSAGGRRGYRLVPELRDREANIEDAGEVRPWRHRGRRRPGSGQ